MRESIEHNSHVSSQLTDHASKKIKAEQSDQSASTDSNTADAQESVNQVTRTTKTYPTNNVGKIEGSYWLRTPNPRNRIPKRFRFGCEKEPKHVILADQTLVGGFSNIVIHMPSTWFSLFSNNDTPTVFHRLVL